MRPELVIFDCDGVLVDSERVTNAVLADRLRPYGIDLSVEETMALFVGGTIALVAEKAGEMGAMLPDTWVEESYEAMFVQLAVETPLVAGILSVLDRLDAAGIPYCVASNGPPRKMEITLGQHGMLERFGAHVYSAHTVGIAKPDPGLFLHAASAFGIPPSACTVIEDSATGARAAARAKMRCFGYSADTKAEKLVAEGATVFSEMSVLPKLLGL